jgi:hypothetical protein
MAKFKVHWGNVGAGAASQIGSGVAAQVVGQTLAAPATNIIVGGYFDNEYLQTLAGQQLARLAASGGLAGGGGLLSGLLGPGGVGGSPALS